MATRCPGCMKLKEKSPVCEHCGYNENVPNYSHQLPVGTKLHGQYTVGKVLGQGGFGITYIGWDDFLQTPIAIKEYYPNSFVNRECSVSLNVNCAGEGAEGLFHHNKERFLREARILAKLQNVPGIVRVQNLFEENNTAYIVMEYVEGIDLKHYIRMQNRVLTCQETFSVLRPIMYALQKVHEAELVHRDISPDNIMILPDGSAKLLDFGAAREVENAEVDRDLPQSTEAILKHGFAPIEQYRRRGSLGPWTDVYALCATMYYCMTGRVPNSAPERITDDDNIDWTRIPGLTRQQMDALEKGMTIMPKARTRSVRELWDGLFRISASQQTTFEQNKSDAEALSKKREEEQRQIQERLEKQRQEQEKKEQLRQEKERRDREKQEQLRLEQEQRARLEAQRLEKQRLEKERREAAKQEKRQREAQRREAQLERKRARQEQQKAAITKSTATRHKPFTILAGLMLVAAIALGAFLVSRGQEKTMQDVSVQAPGETVGTTVETAPENTEIAVSVLDVVPAYSPAENPTYAPDAWKNNVMMVRPLMQCKGLEEAEIQSIIFLDTIANVPTEHWDISKEQNGSVLAWENQNGTVKELYIAADGGMDAGESCEYLFSQCTGLKNIAFHGFLHTDNAKSMKNMFNNCAQLETVNLSTLDTSSVTTMEYMFYNCSNLTELNLVGLETSNVTNMRAMFYACTYLQKLRFGNLDTHNVTDMGQMFANCSSLQSIDLSNIDTAKVTDMSAMFSNCFLLQGIDLSSFNTAQVATMASMFSGCQNLEIIDLSIFNTAKVTSMSSMFSTCIKLCEVDLSNFKTGKVQDMSNMFQDCKSITKLDLNHFITDQVENMESMFSGCTKLKELDIGRWHTWNVKKVNSMFRSCSNLDDLEIPAGSFGSIKQDKYRWGNLRYFMEPGKTINGRPWEEFFQ